MNPLQLDLRYAFRMLWKSLPLSIVAVATLAIGIGATTAVFSVVNGVLLRPLPYYQPEQLKLLWGNTVRAGVVERRGASFPDFGDWRDQSKSFAGMAMYGSTGLTLADKTEPERLTGEQVSAAYFDLLGVSPILGRAFAPAEDVPTGGSLVVVLSHGLWQRRFGGDRTIVGRTLQLNRKNYTVIGVAPPEFKGLEDNADLWIPVGASTSEDLGGRGDRGWQVVGRTKAGISPAAAQTELTNICRRLAQQYPATNEQRSVEVIGLKEDTFADIRRPVLVSLGSVLLVLLIACVNISNLLLARAEGRQREVAIRFALGASRGRILRQMLTESAVLAALGATVGVFLGAWAVPGLLKLSPIQLPSFVNVHLDRTVLAFAAGIGAGTALLVGLLPGCHFWRRELSTMLNSAAGRTGQRGMRQSVRGVLVATEVAFAMLLLVGAGLLIRTFQRLSTLDPGFDADHVVTMRVQTGPNDSDAKTANRALALIEALKAVPGVTNVSMSNDVPLDGGGSAIFYAPEGNTTVAEQRRPRAYVHRVSPDFFSTLRIPLKQGRVFTPAEMRSDARVIIVTEDLVRRFWPGENPIGKRLKQGAPDSKNPWYEIVGVVGDVKYRGLPRNPTPDPDLFWPLHERSETFSLSARVQGDPAQFGKTLSGAVKQFDSGMPIYRVAPMSELVGTQLAASRFAGTMMGLLASIALLLALIGTYSVMSYIVTQRTQDFGIYMALGARSRDIFVNVVGQGLIFAGVGIAAGILGALLLRSAVADLLFGVSATNPVVIVTLAVLMLACTMLACYLPARRATKVDPMVALRYD